MVASYVKKRLKSVIPDMDSFLCQYENELLTGFSGKRKDYKMAVVKILFCPYKTHSEDKNAVAITTTYLRSLGISPKTFKAINDEYKLFNVVNHWKVGKYCKRYYPNEIITKVLSMFHILVRQPKLLIEKTKGQCKEVDLSDFKQGDSFQNIYSIDCVNFVKVNILELEELASKGNRVEQIQASKLLILATSTLGEYGCIPQVYRETDVGRIIGLGVSLQNCTRKVRKAALKGCTDIDMDACHHAIMTQQGVDCPHLTNYVHNKDQVRLDIANQLDVSVDKIKQCFLAISYGADDKLFKNRSIVKALGYDKAKVFWSLPEVRGIYSETFNIGNKLVKDADKSKFKLTFKGKTQRQKVAYVLQDLEVQCLNALRKELGKDAIVLMHDGLVVTQLQQTLDSLECKIKLSTGYNIKLREEVM